MRRPLVTPPLVISVLALFFALGGSAFALRDASSKAPPKCAVGSARAIAYVTGDVTQGIANLPTTWSSAGALFRYRWTCNGGTVEVRKAVEPGSGFDIRFPGNPGLYPVATAVYPTGLSMSLAPNPDHSFHVIEGGGGGDARSDGTFVIVLF